MSIPALNPYLAPSVICPSCGDILQAETVAMGKGRISEARYTCVNEEKKCGYYVTISLQHVAGEIGGMKPEDIEKRRKEAADLKEFKAKGDAAIRELIAMAPALKQIIGIMREDQQPASPDVIIPPPEDAAVASATGPVPVDAAPIAGAATGV